MSYKFTITFKEIERKNLDDYLLQFMEFNRKNVMKILSDNAFISHQSGSTSRIQIFQIIIKVAGEKLIDIGYKIF